MKKIIYFLALLTFYQCKKNKDNNQFIINGNINKVSSTAYLLNFENSKIIDSTNITNGQFKFKGRLKHADFYYLKIKNSPYLDGFFIDNKSYNIVIREVENSHSFSINGGGKLAILWMDYKKIFTTRQKTLDSLFKKIKSKKNNTIYINKYDSINNRIQIEIDSFIFKNRNSLVSTFAILFNKSNIKSLKKHYNILPSNIKKSIGGERILKKIIELDSKKKEGDILKDYEFISISQKRMKLSNHLKKGQLTLIDFWASWCGPCRKQHPSYIKFFNENKKNNFNIISISIDKKVIAWRAAIKKDELPWIQLIDSNSISLKDLKINSIPSNFIIDSKRKIIASDVNLSDIKIILDSIKNN